jgi:hypothetical protein
MSRQGCFFLCLLRWVLIDALGFSIRKIHRIEEVVCTTTVDAKNVACANENRRDRLVIAMTCLEAMRAVQRVLLSVPRTRDANVLKTFQSSWEGFGTSCGV